jgi:NAD(P)-dependent dehydrogenase (short-subunit alcohol dehydrogenase family)
VAEHFGGIDTLFNNAGSAEPFGSDSFDLTIFEGVQKLLVHGVVLGMKYAVPFAVHRFGNLPL